MGGTNTSVTQTPSTYVAPTAGNIGAGAVLSNATVMPLDFTGSTGATATITDVSPSVWMASLGAVSKSLESVDLVTSGALNLATSEAAQANQLAKSSTGSGPYANLISSVGKYALGGLALVVFGVFLWLIFRKKKETTTHG